MLSREPPVKDTTGSCSGRLRVQTRCSALPNVSMCNQSPCYLAHPCLPGPSFVPCASLAPPSSLSSNMSRQLAPAVHATNASTSAPLPSNGVVAPNGAADASAVAADGQGAAVALGGTMGAAGEAGPAAIQRNGEGSQNPITEEEVSYAMACLLRRGGLLPGEADAPLVSPRSSAIESKTASSPSTTSSGA